MKRFLGLGFFLGLVLVATAQTAAPAKISPRTIYLVRHGHYTTTNADADGTLTTLGVAQARLVAARLRGLPVAFTSLTTSSMSRAGQTAEVIHQSLPELTLQSSALLRECTPRSPAIKDETPEAMAAAEGQLNEAFAKFFVPAEGSERHDILVCHGNVIRYLVTKALGVDTRSWLGLSVAHCSLTIIQVKPDGTCKVLAVGDSGHMPPNLVSGLTAAPAPELVVPVVGK